jgi:hypothetical protein
MSSITRPGSTLITATASLLWLAAACIADAQAHGPSDAVVGDSRAALAGVPSGTAVVSYENALLTVQARNAPLLDILRTTCKLLDAQLEAPAEVDQPIFRVVGPAPAGEVLALLLRSTGLNYAISGSPNSPDVPMSVMVFSNAPEAPGAPLSAAARVESPSALPPETEMPASGPNPNTVITQQTSVSPGEARDQSTATADALSAAQLELLSKLQQAAMAVGPTGPNAETKSEPAPRDTGVRRRRRAH